MKMVPKKKSQDITLAPRLLAGSVITKICFSHDSRYLFCCCGTVVKVYNTTNGECLHDLIGHTAVVTGVSVNSSNVLQIYSCCADGLLVSWDYLDGAKLKQHYFHMPLYGIVSIDSKTDSIMMIAKTSQYDKYGLLQWCRDKENPSEFSKPQVLIQDCNKDQELVSFGCMNQFAVSAKNKDLTTYCLKNGFTRILTCTDYWDKKKDITAVACHPTDYCIATGLENGRIYFWYSFFEGQTPHTSREHWHCLAVLSLNFSPDGSILLSGGHECVFVLWQINKHFEKDFKPRMGAPLTRVLSSPDGNYFATLHADNVIQVMDISLKVMHVHRGMSRANWNIGYGKNPIPVGLIYDPRSRAIVTNGLPGHLQFYSLALEKQLYNLDIVGQNYISPESLEKPPVVTEVKKAAVSENGEWLASFEMWDDGFFTPELRLKFWEYKSESNMYVLNTIVESPHDKEITSMCFRTAPPPSSHINPSPTLVTTGADHCFKLWTLVDDTDIYRENTRWTCASVGVYKDMDTQCADFSCDGSSLAVGFGTLLTIWDPEKNTVKTTLSHSSKEKKGLFSVVKFGSGESRYFVVSLAGKYITSWNLLSLTVEMTIEVDSSVLFKDPSSDLMATVDVNGTLTIFYPTTLRPVYQCKNASDLPVLNAAFIPNSRPKDLTDVGWPGSSQIYMYTSQHTLLTFDRVDRVEQIEKIKIHQNLPKSSLSAIMAEKLVGEERQLESKENDSHGKRFLADDDFISTMLHTNEPISAFCDQFLNKLLIKKKIKSKKEDNEDLKEEEEAMEFNEDDSVERFPLTNIIDPVFVDFLKEESQISKNNQLEMDKRLCSPPSKEWNDWCASLSLKN